MIIGSKTALIESELKDRKEKGIKFIELQLNLIDLKNVEETINKKHMLQQYNLTTYALKPPDFNSKERECVLGETNLVSRKENMNLIKKTIILADKMSDLSSPMVVLTVGGLVTNGEFIPDFSRRKKELVQKDLIELRDFVIERYPKVILAVKNNPPLQEVEGVNYNYAYGYEDDFIHWIRELKCRNIGVVLDIGNAMGVVNYNKKLNSQSDYKSIQYFIHSYAPYLKMLQLSKSIGYASNSLEVGNPFEASNMEDKETIKAIINSLNHYKNNSPITLSVKEVATVNALNFVVTRNCLIQSFKK